MRYFEKSKRQKKNDLPELEYKQFWTAISNNAIQMAAINWCKIFGAEKNNKTCYARFVDRNRFIGKFDDITFDIFSEQMHNFRDKFAVHEDDILKRLPIADFDIAIKVIEAFRDTVQEEYDIPSLPTISGAFEAYQLQVEDCLKRCM